LDELKRSDHDATAATPLGYGGEVERRLFLTFSAALILKWGRVGEFQRHPAEPLIPLRCRRGR
jgi:hypothetical protein